MPPPTMPRAALLLRAVRAAKIVMGVIVSIIVFFTSSILELV